MLIYQIVHIESGRKYIGQTTRKSQIRFREHLYSLRKGNHGNRFLQSMWDKYGEQAFRFEIIKEVKTLEELNQSEIEIIKNGTDLSNLAVGGNAFAHDIKIKKAIGEYNKIPIVAMNVKSGEIRYYDSAADAKGDGFDEKCIRKCVLGFVSKKRGRDSESISHKGWVWMSRKDFTTQKLQCRADRAKVAKIRKERSVIGMNVFTDEKITFKSAMEAGRNGFKSACVYKACNKYSAVHKGYVWVFSDTEDPQSLLKEKKEYVTSKPRTGPKSWQS